MWWVYKKIVSPLLFLIDGETSHRLVMAMLMKFPWIIRKRKYHHPVTIDGVTFNNPVGIAAGLIKDGIAIHALARLGVGFIEVGTVTPQSQQGHPRPRLFRKKKERSLVNHMGFNNPGFLIVRERVLEAKPILRELGTKIGINIGKQASTRLALAYQDYCKGLDFFYDCADYLVINISSPNTAGLTTLQQGEGVKELLRAIGTHWHSLIASRGNKVPLLVKISPHLSEEEISTIVRDCNTWQFSGIIATNTMPSAEGGISGAPLNTHSKRTLNSIKKFFPQMPVISVGGIDTPDKGIERLQSGASLVQLYSGLVYYGPTLATEILERIETQPQTVQNY